MYVPSTVIKTNMISGNIKTATLLIPSTLISLIENKISINNKTNERAPNKIKLLPKEKAIKAKTSKAKNVATILYLGKPRIFVFKDICNIIALAHIIKTDIFYARLYYLIILVVVFV